MNPECCGVEMAEIEGRFTNECNEYEIVGYKCHICARTVNLQGEEL